MADPAEGVRQVGEMVEAGVEGMSAVSAALIVAAVAQGEPVKNRGGAIE